MNNYDITLRCMNGFTLYIKGTNLIVATKRSEETFPLSKIQSFELKEPLSLSPERIIFRTAQAATADINLGFGIGASLGAEKSFFYAKSERDIAIQLRDYITGYDEKDSNKEHGKGVVSVVEEIRGLKTLVDEGILTQDEFEAKKKQLLNL